tara:strand:- start:8160 stop:8624 length:465 start_codon:yes stop_codon:yes gene_type:complete
MNNKELDDLLNLLNLPDDDSIKGETAGIISWQLNKDKNFGIHGLSEEERIENASKGGKKQLGNCNLNKWADENPDLKLKYSAKGGSIGGGPRPSTFKEVLVWKWDKENKSKGDFVGEYSSVTESCKQLNLSKGNASAVARGKLLSHRGYVLEYK